MAKFNNEKDDKQLSVNTFSYADRNYESETAVAVKLFNSMVAISIHLPKEGDKSEPKAFDYDHGVTAYLSTKDCKLFSKMGYKSLQKYEEHGEFETISLPLKKGVIEISTIANLKKKLKALTGDVKDPDALCLIIYTDLNDSKVPQSYLIHVFNTGKLLNDYQPETGRYKLVSNSSVECEYFLDTLKEFARAMTNCTAHSISNNSKFMRDKWEKIVYELAVSLGVDLSKSSLKSGSKAVSWAPSDAKGTSSIESRDQSGYKTETIDADEENIDEIINSMLDK